MPLPQLKEEAKKVFERKFKFSFNVGVIPDDITKENIKNFIDSLITKAYEEGRKPLQETEDRRCEQYQCQSYVEGGVVKDCTCGKCFLN